MKRTYIDPEIKFIAVVSEEILAASDEEVFVDGSDLFSNGI